MSILTIVLFLIVIDVFKGKIMCTAPSTRFLTCDFPYVSRHRNILLNMPGNSRDCKAAKWIDDYNRRKRELEIIADIRPHPNLVRIFGLLYGTPSCDEPIGYVMEHMYASLEEVIFPKSESATNYRQMPSYSFKKAIEMAIEICKGIQFLYMAGISHNDIKPSNILVSEDLTKVKLCDFGASAKYDNRRSLTVGLGTYTYMAPELGAETIRTRYTESCDVYSTGITLYELILKRRAYDAGKSAFRIFLEILKGKRPTFPDSSVTWIEKLVLEQCWDEDPIKRPPISVVRYLLQFILQLTSITSPVDGEITRSSSDHLTERELLELEKVNFEEAYTLRRKYAEDIMVTLKSSEYNQCSPELLYDKITKDYNSLNEMIFSRSEGDFDRLNHQQQTEHRNLCERMKTAVLSLDYLKWYIRCVMLKQTSDLARPLPPAEEAGLMGQRERVRRPRVAAVPIILIVLYLLYLFLYVTFTHYST